MSGQRRYLRPIADLRADAEKVADLLDQSSLLHDEVVEIATPTAELVYELIDELESWRALLIEGIDVLPCGRITVMAGPEGVRLVVERLPLRDGGVPDPRRE